MFGSSVTRVAYLPANCAERQGCAYWLTLLRNLVTHGLASPDDRSFHNLSPTFRIEISVATIRRIQHGGDRAPAITTRTIDVR